MFTWQAHNALFIVRCVCKLLIQHLSEEEVIEVLQTSPPTEEGVAGGLVVVHHLLSYLYTAVILFLFMYFSLTPFVNLVIDGQLR